MSVVAVREESPSCVNLSRLAVFGLKPKSELLLGFPFSKAAPSVSAVNISETAQATEVGYGFGIGAPILAMVLSLLAIRFIKKDEAIVRSADRLR